MSRRAKCPMCTDGILTATEGKLDQSGNTYLPTTVWACDVCGCVHYDAAREGWRPRDGYARAADPTAAEAPIQRAA